MQRWAAKFPQVVWLCVCVESMDVARRFERNGGTALNVCVDRDMPQFPAQLGCQGFVVLDSRRRVVTTKSRAFLDDGDGAFRHVEGLIGESITASRVPIQVNAKIRLARLRTDSLNGVEGRVANDDGGDRVTVRLDDDRVIAVKPDNLLRVGDLGSVDHADMDADHAALVRAIQDAYASPHNLAALRDEFRDHAKREEALLAQHLKGGRFSALDSHVADHARILKLAEVDDDDDLFHKVRIFASAIYDHAEKFDALYAGVL